MLPRCRPSWPENRTSHVEPLTNFGDISNKPEPFGDWYRVGLASPCSKGYNEAILRERKQSMKLYEELAMSDTIETRLARVERELAILRSKSTRDKSNWLSEISGSFKDDPHFDEIVRLGKEMRDAEQPENE